MFRGWPTLLSLAVILLGPAMVLGADHYIRAHGKDVPAEARFAMSPQQVRLVPVVRDLDGPVYMTTAHDGSGRMFVVERKGTIRIVKNGKTLPKPFLDIRDRVESNYYEQGLQTVAFAPDFSRSGRFFIDYTAKPDGRIVVAEYQVARSSPDVAIPEGRTILTIPEPSQYHHGGQLRFGPDGDLYISVGDGAEPANYAGRAAQRLGSLLGKILRIDVSHGTSYVVPKDNPFVGRKGAKPEIWAYGLRNPFRFSFDPRNGTMYIGDVGSAAVEELDIGKAGANYGWPIREGQSCTMPTLWGWVYCYASGLGKKLTWPIVQYGHPDYDPHGGDAIVAGYVYLGRAMPWLDGSFVFGDFGNGRIWRLAKRDGVWERLQLADTGVSITSIEPGPDRELYATGFTRGILYRIEPKTAATGSSCMEPACRRYSMASARAR